MYIKTLVLFAILAFRSSMCNEKKAVSFVPEVNEFILKTIGQCKNEYNIEPKTIEQVRQGKFDVDDTFKKFVHCCYYKSGYADEDGHVLAGKVIDSLPKEAHIEEVTKNCSEKKGTDAVDTTYQFFVCFQLNAPIRLALQ